MSKVAILQSNYIPWKGYFDLINSVDYFVIYDSMQYTRRDWRNRNKIQTTTGLKWLSIPVITKNKFHQSIFDTKVENKNWAQTHWETIKRNYAKATYFKEYKELFEELYLNSNEDFLSDINYKFLKTINDILGIETKILFSNEFKLAEGKSERLLAICKDLNATTYFSGPAAKDYLNENLFKEEKIEVNWMDYSNYKPYPQVFTPFNHFVSILDLIFNMGENSNLYMKSFKDKNE